MMARTPITTVSSPLGLITICVLLCWIFPIRSTGTDNNGPQSGFLPNPRCAPTDSLSLKRDGFEHRRFPQHTFTHLTPRAAKSWTVLFYDDADFANAYDPFSSFTSEAFSSSNLNVVVLQDTSTEPARIFEIGESHQPTLLSELGEVDMGSPATLRDFVSFAQTLYPADRYLLAVYDHGGGWRGACRDDTDGGRLTMQDFQSAFDTSDTIDIIAFTAPCLMGALESVYELRDHVDYYIGSEDLSGYVYWRGVIDDIFDLLDGAPELATEAVSQEIIQMVATNTSVPPYLRDRVTMSAVSAIDLAHAVDDLDALCASILDHGSAMMDYVATARMRAKTFADIPDVNGTMDVVSFIQELIDVNKNPELLDELNAVRNSMNRAIVAEHHGSDQEGAGGLTIYFPTRSLFVSDAYRYGSLDFVERTSWLDMLDVWHTIDFDRSRQGGAARRTPDADGSHP